MLGYFVTVRVMLLVCVGAGYLIRTRTRRDGRSPDWG